MMSGLLRAATAAALACTGTASQAADFYFSFGTDTSDPSVSNGVPGTVTGRILGLPDGGTGGALQVLIDTYSPDQVLPIRLMRMPGCSARTIGILSRSRMG